MDDITLSYYENNAEVFAKGTLNTSMMMKDPSYCCKFYWLETIVNLICENITETTFDQVINEMIANAWYSVNEFHVHLSGLRADGKVRDGLEAAICRLRDFSYKCFILHGYFLCHDIRQIFVL